MARQVKCPTCNTMNNKEDTIKINGRYYCKDCGEQKKITTDRNTKDWDELYDYICDLYEIKTLNGMMLKQISDYRNNYNYTNKGILLTLQYYYEILENEVNDDYGLGIIVYYYDKAMKHWIEKKRVIDSLKDFIENEQVRVVQIKKRNKLENKLQEISFDNIEWGDDENSEDELSTD